MPPRTRFRSPRTSTGHKNGWAWQTYSNWGIPLLRLDFRTLGQFWYSFGTVLDSFEQFCSSHHLEKTGPLGECENTPRTPPPTSADGAKDLYFRIATRSPIFHVAPLKNHPFWYIFAFQQLSKTVSSRAKLFQMTGFRVMAVSCGHLRELGKTVTIGKWAAHTFWICVHGGETIILTTSAVHMLHSLHCGTVLDSLGQFWTVLVQFCYTFLFQNCRRPFG